MARGALSDVLRGFTFWLMDVAPIEPLALPIFTPLFGFSGVTAPEVTVETVDISEANWHFKRKVVKHADVSNITLQRGVTYFDSDFWRWIHSAIEGVTEGRQIGNEGLASQAFQTGGPTYRREMVLIQFFPNNPFGSPAAAVAAFAGLAGAIASVGVSGGVAAGVSAGVQGVIAGARAFGAPGPGPFEFAARVPAKAWLLHGCVPIRYKVGADFDAMNSAISIAELEMALEMVEEISLAA